MDSAESPSDLVEILLAGDNPSVKQWEQVQRHVDSDASPRDEIRSGLDADQERRWATAVVLARLGASDGDDLALLVLSEFELGVIPDRTYHYWEQAAWHLQDALTEGRSPEVRELATAALERADLDASAWTDVIDEALGLLESIALDTRAVRVLERVASEHWNPSGRDHAAAILEGHNQATE
jgi:hypothetical protein